MSRHFLPLALSAIVVAGVLASAFAAGRGRIAMQSVAEIAVEHTQPLRLTLSVSQNTAPGALDLSHDGGGSVKISLPQAWTQREIRGGLQKDVRAENPSFGYRRWTLPANAVVSFSLPRSPTGLVVENPSGVLLRLRFTRVDMKTQKAQTEVYLVKDGSLRLF